MKMLIQAQVQMHLQNLVIFQDKGTRRICYSSSQLPDIYLSMVEDQFGFLSNFYLCFNNKWLMSKRCLIIDHRSKYKMRGNCAMGLKDSLEEAKKRFCCIQRILIIIYNWVLKGSLCVAISSLWTDAKICQKMRWSSEMWMVMKKHRGLNQLRPKCRELWNRPHISGSWAHFCSDADSGSLFSKSQKGHFQMW